MTELKRALRDKLLHFRGLIGHPDYASEIEQNAAVKVVRVLEELDEIAEYEVPHGHVGFGAVELAKIVAVMPGVVCVVAGPELTEKRDALQVAIDELPRPDYLEGILIERIKCEDFERYELEPGVFESLREGWLKPPRILMPQRHPESIFKLNRFRESKQFFELRNKSAAKTKTFEKERKK